MKIARDFGHHKIFWDVAEGDTPPPESLLRQLHQVPHIIFVWLFCCCASLFACLLLFFSVCLFACLACFACLLVSLFACLLVLLVCLFCLSACLLVLLVYLFGCFAGFACLLVLFDCWFACLLACLFACLLVFGLLFLRVSFLGATEARGRTQYRGRASCECQWEPTAL